MSQTVQTIIAFAIVLAAALYLLLRWRAKREAGGCGGECGCPSSDLKAKIRQQ